MTDQPTQLGFKFDGEIRRRLMAIERLANLTPVKWSALALRKGQGENLRIERLKTVITENLAGLAHILEGGQLTPEMKTLAKSLRLMHQQQLARCKELQRALEFLNQQQEMNHANQQRAL